MIRTRREENGPVLFLERPRKRLRSELKDKKGPCRDRNEANLEVAVGGVQCYRLEGVCEEGMGCVKGSYHGRLYAAKSGNS